MSVAPGRGRGPVGVVSAVSGPTESVVAVALGSRRDLALVRRCADVAELLSVAEVGLASVAVINEAFTGIDGDVVDRLRRAGLAVVGVVDPDRETSERLRAWAVPVVEVAAGAGRQDAAGDEALALAVVAAGAGETGTGPGGTGPGRTEPDVTGLNGTGPGDAGAERPAGAAEADRGRGDGADDEPVDPLVPTPAAPAPSLPPVPGQLAPRHVGHGHAEPGHIESGHTGSGAPVAAAGGRGRLVAVWGPAGAPGRTTVAVSVAAELAAAGCEVLLVDADTYAASVAQVLGLLDESPGLVAAVRAGLDGRLDPAVLARLAPVASPRLRVLTGLTRAARWSELRPAGLQAVLSAGRLLAAVVVVDLAPPLEEDEELSYDTAAPRRNGAAVDVLRAADDVVVVGSADPVGLQRLVRGLQDLAVVVPSASVTVVVNRVRADAVGRTPAVRVREALQRFAGVEVRHLVPDDRPATDRALLAGRTLLEHAPDSPARAALRELAETLLPGPDGGLRRGARTRAGRGARRGATSG